MNPIIITQEPETGAGIWCFPVSYRAERQGLDEADIIREWAGSPKAAREALLEAEAA